ncbi:hypothetical protein ACJ2A9_22865 [Anaerobacillus sp. MEB173]
MDQKPIHYDGSRQDNGIAKEEAIEQFVLTDEMRVNISGNPYHNEISE